MMQGQKNEFITYMQLGSCLEQENKFLMAYGVYVEAMKKSQTGEKEVIDDYLLVLAGKLSKNAKERNEELKNQLLQWIKEGNISVAIACLFNICEELEAEKWFDTDIAILYQCFCIYAMEQKQGILPWEIAGKEMEEIREWYYQLKFMVRRIDMGVSDEEALMSYIENENISAIALGEMIKQMCFFHQRVYGYLVEFFAKYGRNEYQVFFEKLWSGRKENDAHRLERKKVRVTEKIAFIFAVNDERMYQEAIYYVKKLKVPENMEIEIVPVRGAKSIAAAYNQGMERTDAKFKVYLHQDTMIVDPYFVYEICDIFQNEEIGMIGVAGASYTPENGIWWGAKQEEVYINVYQDTIIEHGISYRYASEEEYVEAKVIDGVMMVTQYDIPWREELFQGWHFYDVSQSLEFCKRNYKIVIPKSENVWCLHEQKWNKEFAKDYMVAREVFLEEYRDFLGK